MQRFSSGETLSDEWEAMPAATRYDSISISFHWATSLLLGAMFCSIWAWEGADGAVSAARLLTLHRSIGVLLWFVTLLRILWRVLIGATPSLPPQVSTAQYVAARTNQLGLYTLLILQPITGFLESIWRGKPFGLFGATFPAIAPRDKNLSLLFHRVHETCATALLVLIGLHALAALFHSLVRRDGVVQAMLPVRSRPPAAPPTASTPRSAE